MTGWLWPAAACGAAVGAIIGWAAPVPLIATCVVLVVLFRRSVVGPVVLVLSVALSAGLLDARARGPLEDPGLEVIDTIATLVDDPQWSAASVRVTVSAQDRHLLVQAGGQYASTLSNMAAGQRVVLRGRVEPLSPFQSWMKSRHVAGRVVVDELKRFDGGALPFRLANSVRSSIETGARPLGRESRALYLGLVYGDDRDQTDAVRTDVARVGLGHLVAVSGQNVAFVIALVAPLLARLGYRMRAIVVLVALAFFATITRFEPSVLRAVTMAGAATVASLTGRYVEGTRILALSVTVLILIDPLLVERAGFQLSVAASAGIMWWAAPLARRMPMPDVISQPTAVSLAAQLAVAPITIITFDGVAPLSVPANIAAGPVAGPVMMWGMTAGWLAGRVPSELGDLLIWPTRLPLWWLLTVARVGASAPLAPLGALSVVALAAAVMVLGHHRLIAIALIVAVVWGSWLTPPGGSTELTNGAILHVGGLVVVELDSPTSPRAVLDGLRSRGVMRVDSVIAKRGGARDAAAVATMRDRLTVSQVFAPPGNQVLDAEPLARGQVVRFVQDGLEIHSMGDELWVETGSASVP